MKRKTSLFLVALLSLVLVGCGGSSKMMMEMQDQMNMMQMQMNSVEAAAATAKDMAAESMMMSGKMMSAMRKKYGSSMMK